MAIVQGVSGMEAAGVLGTVAGASAVSRFASAILTARFGGRIMLTLALIGQGAPIVILFFADGPWAASSSTSPAPTRGRSPPRS